MHKMDIEISPRIERRGVDLKGTTKAGDLSDPIANHKGNRGSGKNPVVHPNSTRRKRGCRGGKKKEKEQFRYRTI